MKIDEILNREDLQELDRKPDANFTADDLHHLSKIRDLNSAKEFALNLVTKPSKKPIKPSKVAWFTAAINRAKSVNELGKIMWGMLLSGEGNAVIGSRHSTDPSHYRRQFGEDTASEWRAYDLDLLYAMLPDGSTKYIGGRPHAPLEFPVGTVFLGAESTGGEDVVKTSYTIYKKIADGRELMDKAYEQLEHLRISPYAKPQEVLAAFTTQGQKHI